MRFLSHCDRTNPWISQRPQHLKSHQRRSWIWYQRTLLCWIARCGSNNIRLEKTATCKFKTVIQLFAHLLHSSPSSWLINSLVYLQNKQRSNAMQEGQICKCRIYPPRKNMQIQNWYPTFFNSSLSSWLNSILVYLPNKQGSNTMYEGLICKGRIYPPRKSHHMQIQN